MLPDHVVALIERGEPVAARISAVSSGFRAWVGVHPFTIHPVTEMPTTVIPGQKTSFRVRCFDLSKEFDLDQFDFHGNECEYRFDKICGSMDEVEQFVKSVLPDLSKLDDVRRCDYPF